MQLKSNRQTAIMFFTRSAQEEAAVKRFVAGNLSASIQIANCLIAHTLQIIRKSGLPYFIIASEQQKGETFGERYANAFQDIFKKGYNNVISVGNDCTSLQYQDLLKAADLMQNHDVVSGVDTKGGLYLVALNKNVFDAKSFRELPWETHYLSEVFISYFNADNTSICQLSEKGDINTTNDLLSILHFQNIHFQLKQLAKNLFNFSKVGVVLQFHFICSLIPCFSSLKSPPAF